MKNENEKMIFLNASVRPTKFGGFVIAYKDLDEFIDELKQVDRNGDFVFDVNQNKKNHWYLTLSKYFSDKPITFKKLELSDFINVAVFKQTFKDGNFKVSVIGNIEYFKESLTGKYSFLLAVNKNNKMYCTHLNKIKYELL